MFLNYLAGVVSLVLAVSAFLPWVTIWFYSLKGIESLQGMAIFLIGLLGMAVAAFQHLSGKIRGRAFILCSIGAIAGQALYVRRLVEVSSKLQEVWLTLTELFGDQVMQKIQQVLGEQWTRVAVKVAQRFVSSASVDSFDFMGGGLVLSFVSALLLLAVGLLLEKNKTLID